MKSIFKVMTALLLPLLFWTGCGRESIPEAGIPDHCIEITLSGLNPVLSTKASSRGDDAYNENLVKSVDCFFYPNGATGSNAVFSALGRGADPVAEGDSTVYKVKVFFTDADAMRMFGDRNSGTCELYVICNAPLSYDLNHSSVSELKELVVENDFTAQTVQGSFVMSADETSTVTLTTDANDNRTASGRIKVSRAAAKIQFFLLIPDEFVDESNQMWEPVLDAGIGISMANAVKKGKVDGDYTVQAADYISYGSRALTALGAGEVVTGHEEYKYTHVPFYSYPCAWSDLSDYAATVVFRIAWRIQGEQDYQWKKYQLSPNISTLDLKRNQYYRTFVNVRSLGGADKESLIIIPDCDYEIIPWMNEGASAGQGLVPGELVTYKYLVMDHPEQTINNESTVYFSYVSSSPIASIIIKSIDYYVNTNADPLTSQTLNRTITADEETINTNAGAIRVNKSNPGYVTMYHSLENMYSAITVYATITNQDGCSQDVVFVQNPSISLIRETQAGDIFINGYFGRVRGATYAVSYYPYNSMANYMRYYNGTRYIYYTVNSDGSFTNGTYTAPSLSGGTWADAGTLTNGYTYQRYFYTDNSESNHFYHCTSLWSNNGQQITDSYNASTESGSYGTILGAIYNLNASIDRNFYTTEVLVTSFNTSNDYYIANTQEVHYRIGDPRRKASEFYTGANSWDTVTNFYKYLYYSGNTESYNSWTEPGSILITSQLDNERDIIAPAVLVSSALNANTGLDFDTAVKRGATYQEAGYPAGRWRLPSEAEIAFIVARQRDGVIPNLYATDTFYWSGSGRLVYVPADSSAGITFSTPADAQTTDTTFSCRFVYDLWYWGDEPSTTNVYHPNGHLYYYDASGNATLIR
ncbi:MAG: hypothetical protein J6W09_06330 [Bacteroidales bacterium]|nr:hypothetical protein [Bacteroidales bacterium]